jgi:hypothetical protein
MPVTVAGWRPERRARDAGAERAVAHDEGQALDVDGSKVDVPADVVREQEQLGAQLAQGLTDRAAPAALATLLA